MDLLNLFRLFLGHKLVALVVIVASGLLLAVAYRGSPPVYRASGSVVLLNPSVAAPVAPSTTTAAANSTSTSLTNVRPTRLAAVQNPYLLFNDLSVVVDILVRAVGRPEVAESLLTKGLTGTYTVAANVDFKRGPIIEVAAEAASPESALKSARLVIAELGDQLQKLQADQGTDGLYSIRPVTVAPPERATTVFSSALRRLIAVGALCMMGSIGALMLAEAVAVGRGRRRKLGLSEEAGPQAGQHPSSPVSEGPPGSGSEGDPNGQALTDPVETVASGGESSPIGHSR